MQGGLVNGVPFFLMVGAGYDARIVNGLNYKTKRLLARAAYTVPVLKTIAHGAEQFDVDVDGRSFTASWVIVTRASHYGGSFTLTRATQMGADGMIAIIVEAKSRTALLAASTALGAGLDRQSQNLSARRHGAAGQARADRPPQSRCPFRSMAMNRAAHLPMLWPMGQWCS